MTHCKIEISYFMSKYTCFCRLLRVISTARLLQLSASPYLNTADSNQSHEIMEILQQTTERNRITVISNMKFYSFACVEWNILENLCYGNHLCSSKYDDASSTYVSNISILAPPPSCLDFCRNGFIVAIAARKSDFLPSEISRFNYCVPWYSLVDENIICD